MIGSALRETDTAEVRTTSWRGRAKVAATRPMLAVFAIALTVRTVAALGIMAFHRGVLIPDEANYLRIAGLAADHRLGPDLWSGYGQQLYRTTAGFTWPLTALFRLTGDQKIVAQLYVALLGAAAAALATRLASHAVARHWAVAAGLIVALVPSQVLWSSVVLRESTVWVLLLVIALAAAELLRDRVPPRSTALCLVAAGAALFVLGRTRSQTAVIAAWAFALVVVALARGQALGARALAVGILLVAPLAAGLGPAGFGLVSDRFGRLAETRTDLAVDADSAIVPTTLVRPASRPNDRGGASTETTAPPANPCEDVGSEACATTRDGEVVVADDGVDSDLQQLPRGLVATLARPYPWEATDDLALLLARVENVGWFGLYGAVIALRERRRALAFPIVAGGAIVLVAALSQGNVGTAFRHRGQILWVLAVLAAIAAERLLGARRQA
jgi:hypothetical protein